MVKRLWLVFCILVLPKPIVCNNADERWVWSSDDDKSSEEGSRLFGRSITGDESINRPSIRDLDNNDVKFPQENGRQVRKPTLRGRDSANGFAATNERIVTTEQAKENLSPRNVDSSSVVALKATEGENQFIKNQLLRSQRLRHFERQNRNRQNLAEGAISSSGIITDNQLQDIKHLTVPLTKQAARQNPIRSLAFVVPADMSQIPLESSSNFRKTKSTLPVRNKNKAATSSTKFTLGNSVQNLENNRKQFNSIRQLSNASPSLALRREAGNVRYNIHNNWVQTNSEPQFRPSPTLRLSTIENVMHNTEGTRESKKHHQDIENTSNQKDSITTKRYSERDSTSNKKDIVYLIGLSEASASKLPSTLKALWNTDVQVKNIGTTERDVRSEEEVFTGFGLQKYEPPVIDSSYSSEVPTLPDRYPGRDISNFYLISDDADKSLSDTKYSEFSQFNSQNNKKVLPFRPAELYDHSSISSSEEKRLNVLSTINAAKEPSYEPPKTYNDNPNAWIIHNQQYTSQISKSPSAEYQFSKVSPKVTPKVTDTVFSNSNSNQGSSYLPNKNTYFAPTIESLKTSHTSHRIPPYEPPRRPNILTNNIASVSVIQSPHKSEGLEYQPPRRPIQITNDLSGSTIYQPPIRPIETSNSVSGNLEYQPPIRPIKTSNSVSGNLEYQPPIRPIKTSNSVSGNLEYQPPIRPIKTSNSVSGNLEYQPPIRPIKTSNSVSGNLEYQSPIRPIKTSNSVSGNLEYQTPSNPIQFTNDLSASTSYQQPIRPVITTYKLNEGLEYQPPRLPTKITNDFSGSNLYQQQIRPLKTTNNLNSGLEYQPPRRPTQITNNFSGSNSYQQQIRPLKTTNNLNSGLVYQPPKRPTQIENDLSSISYYQQPKDSIKTTNNLDDLEYQSSRRPIQITKDFSSSSLYQPPVRSKEVIKPPSDSLGYESSKRPIQIGEQISSSSLYSSANQFQTSEQYEKGISSSREEIDAYALQIPQQVFSEETLKKFSVSQDISRPSFKVEDDVRSTYHNPLRIEVIQGHGLSQDKVVNGQLTSVFEDPIRVIVHKRGSSTTPQNSHLTGFHPSSGKFSTNFSHKNDHFSSESNEEHSFISNSSPTHVNHQVGTSLNVNIPSTVPLHLQDNAKFRERSGKLFSADNPSSVAFLHRGRPGYGPKDWIWSK